MIAAKHVPMRKRRFVLMVTVLAAAGLLAAWGMVWSQAAGSRSDIVATVGNSVITRRQFEDELIHRAGPLLLVRIIDEAVIRRAARQAGIEATKEQVELKMTQAAARAGSVADLELVLKRRGRTVADYRAEMELAALWDSLVRREIQVTDEQLRDYYNKHLDEFKHGDQVRMRLYLGSTRQNAEAFKQMLDAGGDFAGLARSVSEDPSTKDKGGDAGWIERDDYVAAITDVAFALRKGETSDIIKVPDGWAVIRVEDRRPAGVRPFEEVRDEIRRRVVREKLNATRKEWLVKQRKQAHVVIPDKRLRRSVMALLQSAPGPCEESFYGGPPGTP